MKLVDVDGDDRYIRLASRQKKDHFELVNLKNIEVIVIDGDGIEFQGASGTTHNYRYENFDLAYIRNLLVVL